MKVNFNFKKATTIVGTLILLVYAFISLTATKSLHTASQDNEISKVQENIQAHKQYLHDLVERAFVESRILNLTTSRLKASGVSSRATINDFLKSNLENNPEFLGVWMVWEPNAFDGQDEQHIGELSSDETGRFVPYWYWKGDSVVLVRCLYYDESDYYLLPKRNHRPYLLDPYVYPVDSVDSLLQSVVIPIVIDGVFLGVVGVDIRQNEIYELIANLADISGGEATLLSGDNTIVMSSGQLAINKDFSYLDSLKLSDPNEIQVLELNSGSFEVEKFQFLTLLDIEESQEPWKLVLDIPKPVLNGNFMSVWSNLLLLSGVSALFILLLIAYNVSQSKQLTSEKLIIEDKLSQADATLSSYIEGNSYTAIFSVDKNYKYTGFNSIHSSIMREWFDSDVKVGEYMLDYFPEFLRDSILESFQRAMKGEAYNFTSLYEGKYYNQSFNPIFDKRSKVIGVSSSVLEVTERIEAEQQLEEYRDNLEKLVSKRTREITRQKEFFQKVIDKIPAMVFVRDKEGRYVLLNRLSENFFDRPMEEILGKTLDETNQNQDEILTFRSEDEAVINEGKTFSIETQRKLSDGKTKWFYFTKTRMFVDEEPFILGVHVDVTHMKESEFRFKAANKELQETLDHLRSTQMRLIESEKMASVGLLTAGLAHEINNPINYVAGNVLPIRRDLQELIDLIKLKSENWENKEDQQLLENLDELYHELDRLLEGVSEGAGRVIGLIRDLRSFSDNRQSDIREDIDVNACIHSTLNLIRYQPEKFVEFETDLGELSHLVGSSSKLKQVLLNLLTNSCQSIHKEGVVKVSSRQEQEYIYVTISDTGTGIDNEHLDRIFEPFFTTKIVGEGTGLGLAISNSIVQEFGGKIQVKQTSAEGTIIEICFPIPLNQ